MDVFTASWRRYITLLYCCCCCWALVARWWRLMAEDECYCEWRWQQLIAIVTTSSSSLWPAVLQGIRQLGISGIIVVSHVTRLCRSVTPSGELTLISFISHVEVWWHTEATYLLSRRNLLLITKPISVTKLTSEYETQSSESEGETVYTERVTNRPFFPSVAVYGHSTRTHTALPVAYPNLSRILKLTLNLTLTLTKAYTTCNSLRFPVLLLLLWIPAL